MYGTTSSYSQIQAINVLIGRYIKTADVDNHSNVCVINETAATELIGYTDCLGEELALNGLRYTVVGVMEDDESSLTAMFGRGSLTIHIPYTSLIRLSSEVAADIDSFYVSAPEVAAWSRRRAPWRLYSMSGSSRMRTPMISALRTPLRTP